MPSSGAPLPQRTKGSVAQAFLRLLLAYTGLPGYFGMDEEESEMTLPFWYLFQEALWSTDFYISRDGDGDGDGDGDEEVVASKEDVHAAQVGMAKAVYSELVRVLRRKVVFPVQGNGWSKGSLVVPFFICCLLIWLGVRSG